MNQTQKPNSKILELKPWIMIGTNTGTNTGTNMRIKKWPETTIFLATEDSNNSIVQLC